MPVAMQNITSDKGKHVSQDCNFKLSLCYGVSTVTLSIWANERYVIGSKSHLFFLAVTLLICQFCSPAKPILPIACSVVY